MSNHNLKTIDDFKEVARQLVEFAEDACCGHLFEIAMDAGEHSTNLLGERYEGSKGNIFPNTPNHRLAKLLQPDLRREPTFETLSKIIPSEIQERLLEIIMDYQSFFFTLGMVVGAREADPSGKSSERIANGWVRAMLARPGHRHLERRQQGSQEKPRAARSTIGKQADGRVGR